MPLPGGGIRFGTGPGGSILGTGPAACAGRFESKGNGMAVIRFMGMIGITMEPKGAGAATIGMNGIDCAIGRNGTGIDGIGSRLEFSGCMCVDTGTAARGGAG